METADYWPTSIENATHVLLRRSFTGGFSFLIAGEPFDDMSTAQEVIQLLRRAHYELMAKPDFWSNDESKNDSRILCEAASELQISGTCPSLLARAKSDSDRRFELMFEERIV